MDDYFKGNSPYKSTKNRGDIPDSFIMQDILKVQNSLEFGEVLHCICADGDLHRALRATKGIEMYNSISEFLSNDSLFKCGKSELEAVKVYLEEEPYLEDTNLKERMFDEVSIFLSNKELIIDPGMPRKGIPVQYDNILQTDDFEVEYNLEGAKYYGLGICVIPCKFFCSAFFYSDDESLRLECDGKISLRFYFDEESDATEVCDVNELRVDEIINVHSYEENQNF